MFPIKSKVLFLSCFISLCLLIYTGCKYKTSFDNNRHTTGKVVDMNEDYIQYAFTPLNSTVNVTGSDYITTESRHYVIGDNITVYYDPDNPKYNGLSQFADSGLTSGVFTLSIVTVIIYAITCIDNCRKE